MRIQDIFGNGDLFGGLSGGLRCNCPECRSARGEDLGSGSIFPENQEIFGETTSKGFSSEEAMLQDFDKIPGFKYDDKGVPTAFWFFGKGKSPQLWVPLEHFMEVRKVLELKRKIEELKKEAEEKPEAVKVFIQILAGNLSMYEKLPETWKKRVEALVKQISNEALKINEYIMIKVMIEIISCNSLKSTIATTDEMVNFLPLLLTEKENAVLGKLCLCNSGGKPFKDAALSKLNNIFEAFKNEVLDSSVKSIEEKIRNLEAEKKALLKGIPKKLHDAEKPPIKKLTSAQLREAVKNFVCEEETSAETSI
ncbi:MAG: hypothetical protein Q8N63_05070 [Nanoarchaeota archaeon]|nr:hypothetical protein [Nanoarchaeota archaeon]